jgi:DNA-binding GntR family transcriptional regulator
VQSGRAGRARSARRVEQRIAALGCIDRQRAGHQVCFQPAFGEEQSVQRQRGHNPDVAPDYMQQDFAAITPNEYLMQAAPLQGVNYSIEALPAPKEIAGMLRIALKAPCLVLRRRTLSCGKVASVATMWHPGACYQFAGRF